MSPDRRRVLILTTAAGFDISSKPVVGSVFQLFNGVRCIPSATCGRSRHGVFTQESQPVVLSELIIGEYDLMRVDHDNARCAEMAGPTDSVQNKHWYEKS
jgi:hypothetical protein